MTMDRLTFCRRCGAVFLEGAPKTVNEICQAVNYETDADGTEKEVSCSRPGQAVFSDRYYHGWTFHAHDVAPLSSVYTDPPEWAKSEEKESIWRVPKAPI